MKLLYIMSLSICAVMFSCANPRDKRDQKTAENAEAAANSQMEARKPVIASLKTSIDEAFVTSNYLWIHLPSDFNCNLSSSYYQVDSFKLTKEAKEELAEEKGLTDPSLFDGSEATRLCAKPIESSES